MSLTSVATVYVRSFRPRARAELGWFRQQPSLVAAIRLAALAVNGAGKRYSHQRRIKHAALERARRLLLRAKREIRGAANFDGLIHLVHAITEPIPGIGELYVYDTSLRIGAYRGLLPKRVYLHAGTRVGARQLGLDATADSLPVSVIPSELRRLRPHEIEDVLCIFKDRLGKEGPSRPQLTLGRSWCD